MGSYDNFLNGAEGYEKRAEDLRARAEDIIRHAEQHSARVAEWQEFLASPERQQALAEIISDAAAGRWQSDTSYILLTAASDAFKAFGRRTYMQAAGKEINKRTKMAGVAAFVTGLALWGAELFGFHNGPEEIAAVGLIAAGGVATLSGTKAIEIIPAMGSLLAKNFRQSNREKLEKSFREAMHALLDGKTLEAAAKSDAVFGNELVNRLNSNMDIERAVAVAIAARLKEPFDGKESTNIIDRYPIEAARSLAKPVRHAPASAVPA